MASEKLREIDRVNKMLLIPENFKLVKSALDASGNTLDEVMLNAENNNKKKGETYYGIGIYELFKKYLLSGNCKEFIKNANEFFDKNNKISGFDFLNFEKERRISSFHNLAKIVYANIPGSVVSNIQKKPELSGLLVYSTNLKIGLYEENGYLVFLRKSDKKYFPKWTIGLHILLKSGVIDNKEINNDFVDKTIQGGVLPVLDVKNDGVCIYLYHPEQLENLKSLFKTNRIMAEYIPADKGCCEIRISHINFINFLLYEEIKIIPEEVVRQLYKDSGCETAEQILKDRLELEGGINCEDIDRDSPNARLIITNKEGWVVPKFTAGANLLIDANIVPRENQNSKELINRLNKHGQWPGFGVSAESFEIYPDMLDLVKIQEYLKTRGIDFEVEADPKGYLTNKCWYPVKIKLDHEKAYHLFCKDYAINKGKEEASALMSPYNLLHIYQQFGCEKQFFTSGKVEDLKKYLSRVYDDLTDEVRRLGGEMSRLTSEIKRLGDEVAKLTSELRASPPKKGTVIKDLDMQIQLKNNKISRAASLLKSNEADFNKLLPLHKSLSDCRIHLDSDPKASLILQDYSAFYARYANSYSAFKNIPQLSFRKISQVLGLDMGKPYHTKVDHLLIKSRLLDERYHRRQKAANKHYRAFFEDADIVNGLKKINIAREDIQDISVFFAYAWWAIKENPEKVARLVKAFYRLGRKTLEDQGVFNPMLDHHYNRMGHSLTAYLDKINVRPSPAFLPGDNAELAIIFGSQMYLKKCNHEPTGELEKQAYVRYEFQLLKSAVFQERPEDFKQRVIPVLLSDTWEESFPDIFINLHKDADRRAELKKHGFEYNDFDFSSGDDYDHLKEMKLMKLIIIKHLQNKLGDKAEDKVNGLNALFDGYIEKLKRKFDEIDKDINEKTRHEFMENKKKKIEIKSQNEANTVKVDLQKILREKKESLETADINVKNKKYISNHSLSTAEHLQVHGSIVFKKKELDATYQAKKIFIKNTILTEMKSIGDHLLKKDQYDLKIMYSTDAGNFEKQLTSWKQNHQPDSVLFIHSSISNEWEAYLIKNSEKELEKKAIGADSVFMEELKLINERNVSSFDGEKLRGLLKIHSLLEGLTEQNTLQCYIAFSCKNDEAQISWVRWLFKNLQRAGIQMHSGDKRITQTQTDLDHLTYDNRLSPHCYFHYNLCVFSKEALKDYRGKSSYDFNIIQGAEADNRNGKPLRQIPVLYSGQKAESLPSVMHGRVYADFSAGDHYDHAQSLILIRDIYLTAYHSHCTLKTQSHVGKDEYEKNMGTYQKLIKVKVDKAKMEFDLILKQYDSRVQVIGEVIKNEEKEQFTNSYVNEHTQAWQMKA